MGTPDPPPPERVSLPFSCTHIVALCIPARGLWKPFPCIPLSLSLSRLLSKPFPMIMVFHPWWCFEWLALSLAVIWYSTVLHKSFVFLYAESVACRIKLLPLFRGVTTPSYTSTDQFHYEHGLISSGVPHQCSNGRREVPGCKSNPISLHPFPCLPFTSKVPPRAALSCRATDNICKAIVMEDHISSSRPPCLSFLLSHFIPLNLLDKYCPTNKFSLHSAYSGMITWQFAAI